MQVDTSKQLCQPLNIYYFKCERDIWRLGSQLEKYFPTRKVICGFRGERERERERERREGK